MTHPVQYMSPWWRHIAHTCPEIELTVIYAVSPTPEQQGVGFGQPFRWDVPLREGYRSIVCREGRDTESFDAGRFADVDVPGITETIAATRPDLVLLPGWHSRVLRRALSAARRLRVPVLYRGDSHLESTPAGSRRRAAHLRARVLLSRFDAGLAVGRRAEEYLTALGMPPDAIFRVPHCVDNAFFASASAPYREQHARDAQRQALGVAPDAFAIAYVGKLDPVKRPTDAIRAMAGLPHDTTLLVVGSGPEEATCREAAVAVGSRITFLGFVNQQRLGSIYGVVDAIVVPGVETWGLVANEAMASGVPVIASDRVGCVPDLIEPGVTGDVFRCGDVDALGTAIMGLREACRTNPTMPEQCRSRIAHYDFSTATAGLVDACQRTREARGRTAGPRVLVTAEYMVIPGGLERMTGEVVRALRSRGATVHWLLNDWDSYRIAAMVRDLGTTWSYGRLRVGLRRRARNPWHWIRLLRDLAIANRIVLGHARRRRITHVLLPEYLAVLRAIPALWWLGRRGVRRILRLGTAPPTGAFYARVFKRGVDPFVDRYICNSAFTERELHALGVGHGRSRVIHNTVPHRPLHRHVGSADPQRIVFVGQLIPGKGVHVLLDALALLATRRFAFRAEIVADLGRWEPPSYAGYRDALLERARRPDLVDHVIFLGFREDVPAVLAAAGIHVCPSLPDIREAFGLAVLEAKQQALPSVVFPSGGLPDLIQHQVNGWVCRHATAEALAEGLEYYLKSSVLRARHGQAALESAAAFSPETFTRAWCEEFGLIAAHHPMPAVADATIPMTDHVHG